MSKKYICTECGDEILEKDLEENIYNVNERTAPVYQLLMGLNPESNISKFKILTHNVTTYSVSGLNDGEHIGVCAMPPRIKSCGPIKQVKNEDS